MNRLLSTIAASALLIGAAQAADMPMYEPAPVAPVVEAPFSWTGFYLGVAAGYGMTDYDLDIEDELDEEAPFGFGLGVDGFSGEGWLGEATVGFDYQVGRVVLGILGDVRWTNFETDAYAEISLGDDDPDVFGVEGSIETDFGWDALLRAGFLVNDRALLYALGGYSYQEFELGYDVYDDEGTIFGDSTDEDQDGWTVGVGMEAMLTRNVSLKTEYRYTHFDDISYDLGEAFIAPEAEDEIAELSLDPSQHTFTVGVNYKFKGLFGM